MKNQRHDEISHEALCAYVLGEADAAEVVRIERALESSEELRAERDALTATIGLVQVSCEHEAGLAPELLARLESAARPAPRPNPWYLTTPVRMAAGLTALAAGVLAGRAMMQGSGTPEATEVAMVDLIRDRAGLLGDQREQEVGESSDVLLSPDLEQAAQAAPKDQLADRPESALELASVEALRELGYVSNEPEEEVLVVDSTQESARFATTEAPAGGVDVFFLGEGSEPLEKAETRAKHAAPVPPPGGGGGGGGGGPSTPGPSGPSAAGPSSPGPSGPSSPGPAKRGLNSPGAAGAPASGGRGRSKGKLSASTAAPAATPELRARVELRAQPDTMTLEALGGLGYFGSDEELDRDGGDLFFGDGRRAIELTPAQVDALCKERVEVILRSCRRIPGELPRDMFFRYWGDNPFELARLDAQSTFSVDVDTASYALARRYLTDGLLPEKAQIRTEEFVNYFKPDVPAPQEETFAVHTDLTPSRFGASPDAETQRYMMRVVVRGREVAVEERGPLALTFVVDVSGSMREGGRLELVKHSLRLLAAQLDGNDSISIVAFSNEARVVLPMTSAANRGLIEAAVYGLQPDGGTNAEAGLRLGYEMAATALTSGVQNRVVLLSDGVANLGQTDQDRINGDVKARRDSGIYLNTIGVGMNNHNDTFLEQLADKGDGLCNYVDSAVEARRALVENFTGAFEPIARDVKIQVEFDPSQVTRYRLLGYENRAIADADFRNDAVDAGEVGAGHQVVALYELELSGAASEAPLAEVRLRWKAPTGAGRDPREDSATERSFAVSDSMLTSFEGASAGYKRSVYVAQFAEILRRSVHARGDSLDELIAEAVRLAPQLGDADFDELVAMMQKSRALILQHAPRHDTLSTCIDSIRRNEILRAQYDELRQSQSQEVLAELERQNRELEARIEELIRGELEAQLK